MFSHIMIGANDVAAAKKFYDATLGALGHGPGVMDPNGRCFYMTPAGIFAITKPINGQAASAANGGTIGGAAASPEAANAWHAAGIANGSVNAAKVIIANSLFIRVSSNSAGQPAPPIL